MSKALEDLALKAALEFQRRQSANFLECALNLFLVDHSAEEAIERLRALAQHIEEHS